MDIQTTKIELLKMIMNIESDELIRKIADFVKKEEADFWDELDVDQQHEIKIGIEQLDRGERIEFNEFLKKIS